MCFAEMPGTAPPEAKSLPEEDGVRPFGKERKLWFVLLLTLVTLGIYGYYWLFVSFRELRRFRRRGVGGLAGLLLALVVVGWFLLAAYAGRLWEEDGWEDPPISGWSGLWAFFPYVGHLVLIVRIQKALNGFWDRPGIRDPATA